MYGIRIRACTPQMFRCDLETGSGRKIVAIIRDTERWPAHPSVDPEYMLMEQNCCDEFIRGFRVGEKLQMLKGI